jgi:hypothetical protein
MRENIFHAFAIWLGPKFQGHGPEHVSSDGMTATQWWRGWGRPAARVTGICYVDFKRNAMAGSTVISILILKTRRLTSSIPVSEAIRNRLERLHVTIALFT